MPACPRLLVACTALVLSLALPGLAAPVDKYLPGDTDAVVIVNIRQILTSPLVKKHYQAGLQELFKSAADWNKLLQRVGVDPLKDIDQLIFTNGASLYKLTRRVDKGKTVYGSEGGYFFLIKGRFNTAKLHAQAAQLARAKTAIAIKPLKAGTMSYYQVDLGRTLFVGVVDGTTLAVSSRSEPVVEALEKAAGKRKGGMQAKDMVAAIGKLDAKKSVGIAVIGSASFGLDVDLVKVGGKIIEKPVKQTIGQDGIDYVAGSIQVTDGMKADVAVGVRGAAAAKDVAKSLQQDLNDSIELSFNLFVNYPRLAPFAELIKSIKIAVKDNSTVSIEAGVSAQQAADALK